MKTRRKREEDGISGLSNQFVHCLIEKLELKNYHGVLSADEIKAEYMPVNSIYLVNTDPSYRPGEHFLLLFKTKKDEISFYDPLARKIDFYDAVYPRLEGFKIIPLRKRPHQALESVHCGFFVIHFLMKKYSLSSKLKSQFRAFKSSPANLLENDEIVVTNLVKYFQYISANA